MAPHLPHLFPRRLSAGRPHTHFDAHSRPLLSAVGVIAAAVAAALTTAGLAAPATAASVTPDPTVLSTALSGLGAAQVASVARTNGISVDRVRALSADPTSHLDRSGRIYVVEPRITSADADRSASSEAPLVTPLAADVFALHSRPGSTHTIYLDFTGGELSGTAWNDSTGIPSTTIHPYDTDGDPSSFGTDEQATIQSVWERVAEDYITRDVDVTTQKPDPSAITRTNSSDQTYGTRVVMSPDDFYYSTCGCGGIAYVGVIDTTYRHDYYQPAFVFTQGVRGAKAIAEAASHEAGHTVGLSHDGTSTQGYYTGQGLWAPIMGVGYYKPLSQWSQGEYADANNQEDDLAVMGQHGLTPVADDYGNRNVTAAPFVGPSMLGVISTRTDIDVFKVDHPGGAFSIRVAGYGASPDLDLRLAVRDASGTTVASSRPPSAFVNADQATNLGAGVRKTLPAGTYYVVVDGVGLGDPATTGYSDYASIGKYTLTSP